MNVNLSDAEKYLWNYIDKHIETIPTYSIVKLSEEANISTATIVRAMKKKGFDGFTAFKYHLKEQNHSNHTFSGLETVDYEIKRAILKNEKEVNRTIRMLESSTIEEAIQKLKRADKIIIFSRGFSELIAEEMRIKFQLMNKYTEIHSDPNIIKKISTTIRSSNIVVFVSLNGETPELVTAAKNCLNNNVRTITITANQYSSLAALSDILFHGYKSEHSYFPDYEVRSRLPLSIIARILLDSYSIRTKNS